MHRRTALKAILALPFAPRILERQNSLEYMGTESGRFTMPGPKVGDIWVDVKTDTLYRYHRVTGWNPVEYSV